jgi:transcriptional regulator with XRE-family HTH domain
VNKKGKPKQYRDDVQLKMIGENIRKYRLQKGFTQSELAFECEEKDWSQISRMERGLVNFHVSYLFKVSEALGVTPIELLQ